MRPTHKLKVEGASGFVRDMSNGAILYTKQEEVNEARHRKAQRLAKEDKIQKLENDVSEIKEMLKVLVEKNG
tara:strand:- start:61 stop:276 length:216 start_codon:yes stop_codon:yes gene_type:complete